MVVVLTGYACSSTGSAPGGEEWSRSYAHTFDRVWRAVTDTLTHHGYALDEVDRERGLVRAESREDRAYDRLMLEVQVFQRGERVKVLIQGRGGGTDSAVGYRRIDEAVAELLIDLDGRLRSPRASP
jgi:hypothetical protein